MSALPEGRLTFRFLCFSGNSLFLLQGLPTSAWNGQVCLSFDNLIFLKHFISISEKSTV